VSLPTVLPDAHDRGISPPVADWFALRLFGQYRLLMLVALAAAYYASSDQSTLGGRDGELFEVAHLGYTVFALGAFLMMRLRRPRAETQFHLQSYADILFVALLAYASGGVQSGLGPWLLVNMALLTHFTTLRHAFLFASIASLVILAGEVVARLRIGTAAADFEHTALLGGLLFVIAWLMSVPVRQLVARQMTEPTAGRARLDVRQISELNEEIVRELDSGVVVVNAHREVLLVNDTARTLLAAEFTALPLALGKLSPSLATSLREAEQSPTLGTRPFTIDTTGQSVLPQYISLSAGGMLIKLDDHAHIRQQFQQLKLASLGRLSASIAHEIRNPLGAISHAVQLIEESPTLDARDAELLSIARRHTVRIDRIVNDVLQLSNRQQVRTAPISVPALLAQFAERFRSENALPPEALVSEGEPGLVAVFDPGHLDQVLWNLCTNARLHNDGRDVHIALGCHAERPGVAVIEVSDDGAGIADIDRERLFEPFYSTHHNGSGLGLYIIRELCELNRAEIECLPVERGARFRITLASAGRMAA